MRQPLFQHFTAEFLLILCYDQGILFKRRCISIKAQSHLELGRYLSEKYLKNIPVKYIRAFLLGCIEPDKNPTTYLKGSIRSHFLRGHNWESSQRYMQRIAKRLEHRKKLRLTDYYTLGKLVHYTADAFTYAHNNSFPKDLPAHRRYESSLQRYFLSYLQAFRPRNIHVQSGIMEQIRQYHREYRSNSASIQTDSKYCITVTSMVMAVLSAKVPLPAV